LPDLKKYTLPAALVVGCLPWVILFIIFVAWVASFGRTGNRVGLIHVSGVITAGRDSGGVLSSTFLTLIVLPVLCLIFVPEEKKRERPRVTAEIEPVLEEAPAH
jgi:uncharacterized membrane protein YecN with MAPEG domain